MAEDKKKKAQEIYAEYQALEQHIKQLQKQLEVLTSQIMEMGGTSRNLEDFEKTRLGREIFVPISSGVFAKASLKDISDVLVNVGANVVVKKDILSAKKLINNQVDEMKKLHKRMIGDLERLAAHASGLETQLQKLVSEE